MEKKCTQCGAALADTDLTCPFCGAQANNAAQPAQADPFYSQQSPEVYPDLQAYIDNPLEQENTLSMKWYKFIIYFQLFANCLINVINAFSAFTGSQYGSDANTVYDIFPDLNTVDKVYAVALIGVAVYAIIVRGLLKNFRKKAPVCYHIFIVANIIISIIYMIAANNVIVASGFGEYYNPDYTTVITNCITTLIMLVCNIVYFNKRKNMFNT